MAANLDYDGHRHHLPRLRQPEEFKGARHAGPCTSDGAAVNNRPKARWGWCRTIRRSTPSLAARSVTAAAIAVGARHLAVEDTRRSRPTAVPPPQRGHHRYADHTATSPPRSTVLRPPAHHAQPLGDPPDATRRCAKCSAFTSKAEGQPGRSDKTRFPDFAHTQPDDRRDRPHVENASSPRSWPTPPPNVA